MILHKAVNEFTVLDRNLLTVHKVYKMDYPSAKIVEGTLVEFHLVAVVEPKTGRIFCVLCIVSNKSAVYKYGLFHILKAYMNIHVNFQIIEKDSLVLLEMYSFGITVAYIRDIIVRFFYRNRSRNIQRRQFSSGSNQEIVRILPFRRDGIGKVRLPAFLHNPAMGPEFGFDTAAEFQPEDFPAEFGKLFQFGDAEFAGFTEGGQEFLPDFALRPKMNQKQGVEKEAVPHFVGGDGVQQFFQAFGGGLLTLPHIGFQVVLAFTAGNEPLEEKGLFLGHVAAAAEDHSQMFDVEIFRVIFQFRQLVALEGIAGAFGPDQVLPEFLRLFHVTLLSPRPPGYGQASDRHLSGGTRR